MPFAEQYTSSQLPSAQYLCHLESESFVFKRSEESSCNWHWWHHTRMSDGATAPI